MKKVTLFFLLVGMLMAGTLDFTLHKKGKEGNENVLLVIGGIQGDEPGGFNAASLLVTHYTITKGTVWVVPNLNFFSIVERSRGPYGDMNRKFANLPATDPEYDTVERIKSIILDPRVDMVLNLHDGSGFYRTSYIDQERNPYRWGQSCIIDQASIPHPRYGDLDGIAHRVQAYINDNLVDKEHRFGVKNTRTSEGDEEMAKSLTYFAIRNNKPAFGIEGSKNFGTHYRAYYHLLALEKFMDEMGIEYVRNFELSPVAVKDAIDNNDIRVVMYDNKLLLPVSDARTYLHYIPMKKDASVEYRTDHPLVAVVEKDRKYRVCYGNRRMALLYPQYFEYDYSLNTIDMNVDGIDKIVPLGTVVNVGNEFTIREKEGYRVNIIGFSDPSTDNEVNLLVEKSKIPQRFSIDKSGKMYRVEIYKEDKFSGMVLVNFDDEHVQPSQTVARVEKQGTVSAKPLF